VSYKLVFTPKALRNYTDAVEWYCEQNIQAAENFVMETERKFNLIRHNPLQYSNYYKYFRETVLNKFPFSIIYFMDTSNKTVIVSAVFHHSKNPKTKYNKE
jgi:plasmid stabilization system protein ParE